MNYPIIQLKKNREQSLKRFHPWIFSGAIEKVIVDEETILEDGTAVWVQDHQENILATGLFAEGSIAVRILSFNKVILDVAFFYQKLEKALQLRAELELNKNESTTAYRLVHGEGDQVGGLIIDIYGDNAVIQAHTSGIFKRLPMLTEALQKLYGQKLKAIYNKSEDSLQQSVGEVQDNYLFGEAELPVKVLENGHTFKVDWERGQKTAFFLDQRENRALLARYAKGKKVLNTFCYSGGFSIYALEAGAKEVQSVDSSAVAIEMLEQNIKLCKVKGKHQAVVADSLKYIKQSAENFDIIVLDPPAYAKHPRAKHKAVQAYRRLNEAAMKKLNSGGLLFTFSCSQAIDRKLFEDTIRAAAISSKQSVKVLHHLSQGADHPANIFHPEGSYLKGLVVQLP
jgi:23S rRNA (cytosine1962-C5)-methyltransferase